MRSQIIIAGALLLLATATAFAGPVTHQKASWEDPAYQQALLGTLDVAQDGTLVLADVGTAAHLLGRDFQPAYEELQMLNTAIRSGTSPRFTSRAELANFEVMELLDADAIRSADTHCIGQCYRHLCCCHGWWIFCWGWCSC